MKFKPFARRNHRRLMAAWGRKHKGLVAAAAVAAAAIAVIATVALSLAFEPAPWRWYVLGVVHMGGVAACTGLLWSAFHVSEHQAIHQLRGAWGEENTRDVLLGAKRRRLIWGWVDSITLETGDIDHLVVTRRGGLVAIDSKYRSSEYLDHPDELRTSASLVRTRAQGVVARFLTAERGQHRSKGPAHRVTPLVVVWGKAQEGIPVGANIEGVQFVGGRHLRRWLTDLDGEVIDRRSGKALIRELEAARAAAWAKQTAKDSVASRR